MKESKTEIVTVPQDEKGSVEIIPFGTDERIRLSVAIVQNMIAVATRTGKIPDAAACIKFMMLCRARHLNPFEGDCFMLGYDTQSGPQFSMITAHQVFLKRAEASKGFDGMKSGVIVNMKGAVQPEGGMFIPIEREGDIVYAGEELLGGWAQVYRKDRQHPFYKRLKLSTFNTGRSRWEKDPAGMIVKCAEADALRTAFPTHLGGLYLQEEQPPIDVGPVIERAKVPKIEPPHYAEHPNYVEAKKRDEKASAGNIGVNMPSSTQKEPEEPGSPAETVSSGGDIPALTETPPHAPPKKKPILKPKSSPSNNDVPPFQREMLNRLKQGSRGPEDLLKVAIAAEWCSPDEQWPLPEEKLELFLDGENWLVLTQAMDELPANVMKI